MHLAEIDPTPIHAIHVANGKGHSKQLERLIEYLLPFLYRLILALLKKSTLIMSENGFVVRYPVG